jgi:16S rRNA (uracil1498-N3)-methyltransferase
MTRDHPHRFLHYATSLQKDRCRLAGDEHKHLSRVLRMKPGDETAVTDGRGLLAYCVVESVGRNETILEVHRTEEITDPGVDVTLAIALLKKDAFEQVIRECVELGVTRFVPFAADKSHLRTYSDNFVKRLGKIGLSAMKQAFRTQLPTIERTRDLEDLPGLFPDFERVIAGDADGAPYVPRGSGAVMVVVGPEGGFTTRESERLAGAGAELCRAVPGRLRSETAAASLVTCVRSAAA